MIKLTDEHITGAARELTANPNCRVARYHGKFGNSYSKCGGRLVYVDGEVRMLDTCGKPCDFVLETARKFQEHCAWIKGVVRALNSTEEKEVARDQMASTGS